MTVLVTGAAGFIGFHVSRRLLERGETVVGIDDLNAYYEVSLKAARRDRLVVCDGFHFVEDDVARPEALQAIAETHPGIDRIVHLAAQPGVRYSLIDPLAYVRRNVLAHVVLLEAAARLPALRHVVYASSSSVYGDNPKIPFAVGDPIERPSSLYAATKAAAEAISRSYAATHGLPLTGLRFFTVYGPWGRPDMATFSFARKIRRGEPVPVYGYGLPKRDYTYVDDIVDGVLAALDRPPEGVAPPHRVFNLGNDSPETVATLIDRLEAEIGRAAIRELLPMQTGDAVATHADIALSREILGFAPKVSFEEGLRRFVQWLRDYEDV